MRAEASGDGFPATSDPSDRGNGSGGTGDTRELLLLGGFVFSVGGDALVGVSAGSQRLLAFLALRDRSVTRTQVAGTFWPESTDEHAGASLRSAVSRLDGAARHALKVTAGDLGLAEGVVVDVQNSRALARRLIDRDASPAEIDIGARAVRALSNDLLPDWYDDWAVIAAWPKPPPPPWPRCGPNR
jgi:two-component SAPR family response regulator